MQSDSTHFYHIGIQHRGRFVGKRKRKEEVTTLASQVSACLQLNQYGGAQISSVESYQDRFLSVLQFVHTVKIKKVWLLPRVLCALSKNVKYIKKKSKQSRA